FGSAPPGALVKFQGKSCVTPCTLDVDRKGHPSMVEFQLDGYKPYMVELSSVRIDDSSMSAPEGTGVRNAMGYVDAFFIVPGVVSLLGGANKEWPKSVEAVLPPKDSNEQAMARINR